MDNPYAPPLADRSPQPEAPGSVEILWRVEGGKLLARPGAVLPEVCVRNGAAGLPGSRTLLPFAASTLTGHPVPAERITFFQGRPALVKGWCMLAGGPLLGIAASIFGALVLRGDDPATKVGASVCFCLMVVGGVVPLWLLPRELQTGPVDADGWYEIRNVHPAAIRRLRDLQPGIPGGSSAAPSNKAS